MKKYQIEYTLLINRKRMYFISPPLKAICKFHALLKFKRKIKHKKEFKREILKVGKCENVQLAKENNKKSR